MESLGVSCAPIARCRSCGAAIEVFLSLGATPLANALVRPEDAGMRDQTYPLDVALCSDCTLVQITVTVPPEQLFGNYIYFSSFSTTMVEHARALVERVVAERRLGAGSLVLEIASNDGYLLQWYSRAGVPVLGIEPAANVAKVAVERGVPTECAFFDRASAARLAERGCVADVVHAHNVMAHVGDLDGFVGGLSLVLAQRGVAILEVPYLKDLLDNLEFDTIYHEHLCYFSASALTSLLGRHGLELHDVERLPIHGGSLRLFVGHAGESRISPAVAALLAEEKAWGVGDTRRYREFAERILALRAELLLLLDGLKAQGRRLAAYGASAKGSTLLNTFGIGRDRIEFVADRSTYKQGLLMPGVHIPIVAPERLVESGVDDVLLLTWNFADEILAQQEGFRRHGGRFIVPVPTPRIV